MTRVEICEVPSPIGPLAFAVHQGALCALDLEGDAHRMCAALERRFGPLAVHRERDPAGVAARLAAYFGGELEALGDIAAQPGGTAFQQAVWTELRRIPVGATASYGDIARAIGRPRAVRAVGQANAANPIAIVIPCHRVIGSNRSLTGYGGGLDRKRWLLAHESRALSSPYPVHRARG
jgi:methylated-DNA-[protein]-cysteine S-methyltransferase